MKHSLLIFSGIIAIAITTYFSLLPLNGVTQADISNMFSTPITPAGFTFSIWSIIYASWLLLWAYVVWKKPKLSSHQQYALAWAQLLSAAWLIPWHFQYILTSFCIMTAILVLLWSAMNTKISDKWYKMTLSLFLGWISIAFLLNFNTTLIAYDLYQFPLVYSGITLMIWLFLTSYWGYKQRNFIPLWVFAWAVLGILLK